MCAKPSFEIFRENVFIRGFIDAEMEEVTKTLDFMIQILVLKFSF